MAQSCCGLHAEAVRRLSLSLDVGLGLCPGASGQRGAAHPPYPCRVWCGQRRRRVGDPSQHEGTGGFEMFPPQSRAERPSFTHKAAPNRLTHQALCPHDVGTTFRLPETQSGVADSWARGRLPACWWASHWPHALGSKHKALMVRTALALSCARL